jgi:hypothetical protein
MTVDYIRGRSEHKARDLLFCRNAYVALRSEMRTLRGKRDRRRRRVPNEFPAAAEAPYPRNGGASLALRRDAPYPYSTSRVGAAETWWWRTPVRAQGSAALEDAFGISRVPRRLPQIEYCAPRARSSDCVLGRI